MHVFTRLCPLHTGVRDTHTSRRTVLHRFPPRALAPALALCSLARSHTPRHDAPVADEDAPDGHLAQRERRPRLRQGSPHERTVVVLRRGPHVPARPARRRHAREQQEHARLAGSHVRR